VVQTPTGIRLRVRVQPRASRTEIAGPYGNAVKVRLAAPPVEGAANEALARFIARHLGVPRSAVRIESGATSRSKIIDVDGIDLADGKRLLGI
jgi:uncharacterized protein (TIGR00251 family)